VYGLLGPYEGSREKAARKERLERHFFSQPFRAGLDCAALWAGLVEGLGFFAALGAGDFLARAAWEKRRQSRRTLKVLGGRWLLRMVGALGHTWRSCRRGFVALGWAWEHG
jgi:hypothetical protein